ncbi:MAG: F390 synthetase-related protein [Candidatus Berkiella sp.]
MGFWFSLQIARLKALCIPSSVLRFIQLYKLRKLFAYVDKSIPYYKAFKARSFHQLPISDKALMQENFQNMNASGFTYHQIKQAQFVQSQQLFVNYSLGTSGKPSAFLYTQKEKLNELTSLLANMLPVTFFAQKVAIFYLSETPYFPKLKSPFYQWQFFDLKSDVEQLLQKLDAFSPDLLVAPVQILCKIAQYQNENKINIQPKKIVAIHEVLTPIEEKIIATTFSQNVHKLYQCAEGFLGTTCEMGTLHLDEDNYYIEKEWIDSEKEKFIPVISTLNRRLQPLVRYRMNDILCVQKNPCSCGSAHVAIKHIIGRCEDMLYFQKYGNNGALKPIYADDIHLAIAKASGGIEKYQLRQSSVLNIEIQLKAANFELAKHCISQQLEKLSQQLGVKCPFLVFTALQSPPVFNIFRQTVRLSSHTSHLSEN